MADTRKMPSDALAQDGEQAPQDLGALPNQTDVQAESNNVDSVDAKGAEDEAAQDAGGALQDEGAEADHDKESVSEDALADKEPAGIFSRVKWGRVALAILFVFLLTAAALFVWNRWYRYDDVADFQGTWRDVSSGAEMQVNATHIMLAEDAVYEYKIDTFNKQISYVFGHDEGSSSYRFSEDRSHLVLEDSVETDWSLVFHFRDDPGFAEGELPDGTTRLEKVSSDIPEIVVPGSNRNPSEITISEPQKSSSSSSAAADADSSSSNASSSSDEEKAPQASQTVPDENGFVVSPDRNSKGYYDKQGIFVAVSYGHFDAKGNWVEDPGGYTDENGYWVEGPSGYYGLDGLWVEFGAKEEEESEDEKASEAESGDSSSSKASSGEGYYDQYGRWIDMDVYYEQIERRQDENWEALMEEEMRKQNEEAAAAMEEAAAAMEQNAYSGLNDPYGASGSGLYWNSGTGY